MNPFELKIKSKTDVELASIVGNPGKYQTEFIEAALGELKSRDIAADTSTAEFIVKKETATKDEAINSFKFPKDLPRNIRLASNLIFLGVIIGLTNFFVLDFGIAVGIGPLQSSLAKTIFTLCVFVALGVAVRLGAKWVKYVFLILFAIGLIPAFVVIPPLVEYRLVLPIITMTIQFVLQITVIFLLFSKPASKWYAKKDAT